MSRSRRLGKWFTTRKIAEVLLVAWVVIVALAAVVPVYPQVPYSPYPDSAVFPSPCIQSKVLATNCQPSPIPHTLVTLAPTFLADDGVYAANNPITILGTLTTNRSNFMQYYVGVGFFEADFLNGTSQGVYLPLSRGVNNHTYLIVGTLQWATAAPVYWYLVPQHDYFTTFLLGPHSNTTSVMLNVTGAENTLALQASESATRWNWVGFASGVVGLFEVVNAVVPQARKRGKGRK